MKSFCLFLIYLLLSDYYETCTDYVKHKTKEIFFLEIFYFNTLIVSSLYKKKRFKKLICNTILDAFAIIIIYYYALRCVLGKLGSRVFLLHS